MKHKWIALFSAAALICSARAEDKKELKDQKEKVSYSFGMNIANSFKNQDIEIDFESMAQGFKDIMAGKTPLLNEQQVKDVMNAYRTETTARRDAKRKAQGEKNKTEGEKFLAENKNKPGVKIFPSGLQYKVLTEGNGPIPKTNDMVSVNYRGTLLDGTEFDSSFKRGTPAKFNASMVIKGWTEALTHMPVGSKWQLFIPSDLAYREFGSGRNIGPNATLIFEVELLGIEAPAAPVNPSLPVTSDIIKVPSSDELKKGAKIEVIKPDQLPKTDEKAKK